MRFMRLQSTASITSAINLISGGDNAILEDNKGPTVTMDVEQGKGKIVYFAFCRLAWTLRLVLAPRCQQFTFHAVVDTDATQ